MVMLETFGPGSRDRVRGRGRGWVRCRGRGWDRGRGRARARGGHDGAGRGQHGVGQGHRSLTLSGPGLAEQVTSASSAGTVSHGCNSAASSSMESQRGHGNAIVDSPRRRTPPHVEAPHPKRLLVLEEGTDKDKGKEKAPPTTSQTPTHKGSEAREVLRPSLQYGSVTSNLIHRLPKPMDQCLSQRAVDGIEAVNEEQTLSLMVHCSQRMALFSSKLQDFADARRNQTEALKEAQQRAEEAIREREKLTVDLKQYDDKLARLQVEFDRSSSELALARKREERARAREEEARAREEEARAKEEEAQARITMLEDQNQSCEKSNKCYERLLERLERKTDASLAAKEKDCQTRLAQQEADFRAERDKIIDTAQTNLLYTIWYHHPDIDYSFLGAAVEGIIKGYKAQLAEEEAGVDKEVAILSDSAREEAALGNLPGEVAVGPATAREATAGEPVLPSIPVED